ncbi:MAG TPA: hypothetical protein VHN38_07185, partial [Immundisolibacter sp.]|nr:hypothetical protein [Immundisolibacter sp.]
MQFLLQDIQRRGGAVLLDLQRRPALADAVPLRLPADQSLLQGLDFGLGHLNAHSQRLQALAGCVLGRPRRAHGVFGLAPLCLKSLTVTNKRGVLCGGASLRRFSRLALRHVLCGLRIKFRQLTGHRCTPRLCALAVGLRRRVAGLQI